MTATIYDISRRAGGLLSDRLAENLRKAVAAGELKGGERLPSIRKMAELCGTSVRVPLAAVRQLQKEGVLEAHPRRGIAVLGKSHKLWKGRVLFIINGGDANFYVNALNASVSNALLDADYRVEYAFVSSNDGERDGCVMLSKMLRDDYDLAIFPDYDDRIVRLVKASGVPYFVYSTNDFVRDANCVGVLARSFEASNKAFFEHCTAAGVRSVLQVRYANWSYADLTQSLSQRKIAVKSLEVPLPMGFDRLEVMSRSGFKVLSARLADRRFRLPDLIFFADDFLARGGLWALADAGVRIPEDVAVVTVANRGFLPCFPKKLTRLESDTLGNARIVARQALRYLSGKRKSVGVAVMGRQYVRGETF